MNKYIAIGIAVFLFAISWSLKSMHEDRERDAEVIQHEIIEQYKSYDDVVEYKKRIQSFIRNVVERSEKIESRISGSRFRGTMTQKMHIEIINRELNELTREFMKTQVSVIKVAASIDKIQGLLINLEL